MDFTADLAVSVMSVYAPRQPVPPDRVVDSLPKFPSIQGFLIVTAVHFG
jgi:hypothetical protein